MVMGKSRLTRHACMDNLGLLFRVGPKIGTGFQAIKYTQEILLLQAWSGFWGLYPFLRMAGVVRCLPRFTASWKKTEVLFSPSLYGRTAQGGGLKAPVSAADFPSAEAHQ